MMSRSHLIIIIGLAYNPVPYERVTAACKNRAAPGAAMTGKGYNGTPVQPQITQWGQLGEILGGVRFPWAGSLPVADDFPICAGCQGQMAHNKKTNRILYFAGNGAGLMACPVSGLLNIQEVSLCERLSGVAICSMQT